jgi:TatA/E family protein of Tat protein translocase
MNFGFSEMAFLFFLALLLFGPKKLPEIGRQIGRVLNEFKRASNEFRAQIETEIANMERETAAKPEVLPPVQAPAGAVATGTLIDASPVEPTAAPLSAEASATSKGADA